MEEQQPAADWVPQRSGASAWTRVGDELAIVHAERGTVAVVNEVGATIWETIDGCATVTAIIDRLVELYEAERATIEREVRAFIGSLQEQGMICR